MVCPGQVSVLSVRFCMAPSFSISGSLESTKRSHVRGSEVLNFRNHTRATWVKARRSSIDSPIFSRVIASRSWSYSWADSRIILMFLFIWFIPSWLEHHLQLHRLALRWRSRASLHLARGAGLRQPDRVAVLAAGCARRCRQVPIPEVFRRRALMVSRFPWPCCRGPAEQRAVVGEVLQGHLGLSVSGKWWARVWRWNEFRQLVWFITWPQARRVMVWSAGSSSHWARVLPPSLHLEESVIGPARSGSFPCPRFSGRSAAWPSWPLP